MLKTSTKFATFALLLTSACSQVAYAEVKMYRYDGKLPFIRMMLGMMDAMGVIDSVPANGAYGRYGYPSSSRTRSGLYGSSSASPLWGSPDWGVLPTDRYAWGDYDQYPGQNYRNYRGAKPYWSESDLDGWVDEPWEISPWNPENENLNRTLSPRQQMQRVQPQASEKPPLVQNFNFSLNENGNANSKQSDGRRNESSNRQRARSPLSKLAQPGMQPARRPVQPPVRPSVDQKMMRSPLAKKSRQQPRRQRKQKPCVTEFCGLKKPDLNGLWVAENGEMLGVKNTRYLWSDGEARYLTGQIKIQNEYLVANIDNKEKIMRFKYKLAGNHLLTMQSDGTIREFVKMPTYQKYNNY